MIQINPGNPRARRFVLPQLDRCISPQRIAFLDGENRIKIKIWVCNTLYQFVSERGSIVNDGLKIIGRLMAVDFTRIGTRAILAISVGALSIVAITLLGPGASTTAQETTSCQVIDLGTLATGADSSLEAEGRR